MSPSDQTLHLPLPVDGPLDPPAAWERLRRQCPVAPVELPSGDTAAFLSRYDDVRNLLADRRFARPRPEDGAARLAPDGAGGVATSGSSTDLDHAVVFPENGDPHRRWRLQVAKYFTAKRMAALRPAMVETTERFIDEMTAHGQPGDLRAALGFPLPVYVICTMLGAPVEDRDRFSHWSDAFLSVSRFSAEELRAAHAEFVEYMSRLIAAKRAEPGDDLISMLIEESRADGEGMSDEILLGTAMGLLVAGHETTANMISKMVSLLLADRTRWESLLADPSLVRTAVEEVLRYDANLSTFGLSRYVKEDTELAGGHLPGGTTVLCGLSSANRDESVFADADRMDLGRSPNPHLTFGAGAHSCLGQALARTELQVVLDVLLRRLPTLRLAVPAEELERVDGLVVGGLRAVPVRW